MTITSYQTTRFDVTVSVTAVSDLVGTGTVYYHWYLDGAYMATTWELIAAQKTIPEIRDFLNADSLGYLSHEGLIKAVGLPKETLCLACFTGEYPIPVQLEMGKLALETTVVV